MSEEKQTPPPGDDGIFGKLPSSRPGSRSPRRKGGASKEEPKAAKRAEKGSAAAPSPPKAPEPPPEPSGPPETAKLPPSPGTDPSPQIKGVEDLAWAGVTVAAKATTLGVRLASRALTAARKSIDRP